MISLIIRFKFNNLISQLFLRHCLSLRSYTSSSVWLYCLIIFSRLWFWFSSFIYLHIRSRWRFNSSNSDFCFIIHIARIFNWCFGFSKPLFRLRTSIFNHFNSLFHFLNRCTWLHFYFHFRLVINCNVIIATWRGFLFGFRFLCPIIFCTIISWFIITFFNDLLKSCCFWIDFNFLIQCLLRLIIIWRNCLLCCRFTPSARSLIMFFLSWRFTIWSFLWKPSIYFFN